MRMRETLAFLLLGMGSLRLSKAAAIGSPSAEFKVGGRPKPLNGPLLRRPSWVREGLA